MSNHLKTILFGLLFFLLCCACVFFYGKHRGYQKGYDNGYPIGYKAGYDAPHPSEIVVKKDTEYVDKPVPIIEYRDTGLVVYVPVVVKDSTGHIDTTLAPLHPEVKQYADSTYRAQVSGIQPNLDWIEVYQKTTYITTTVTTEVPYKFTLSAFADGTATFNYFCARAGLQFDYQIYGPFRGYTSAGYEYGSVYKGGFVTSGIKANIFNR